MQQSTDLHLTELYSHAGELTRLGADLARHLTSPSIRETIPASDREGLDLLALELVAAADGVREHLEDLTRSIGAPVVTGS